MTSSLRRVSNYTTFTLHYMLELTIRRESIAHRTKAVVENLAKRKSGKPRTLKTLRTTIKALLGSQLMEDELDRLIEQLTTGGVIRIADGKVQYEPPT
jgi:hypothetical protein